MFLIDDVPETRIAALHFVKVTIEAVLPKYLSKRFVFTRYMNWTEEQFALSEKMWAEENPLSGGKNIEYQSSFVVRMGDKK